MNYEVRLPGYGGAGVFLRRTICGDPPSRKGIDLWLLGPTFCTAVLGRETDPGFLPDLARYLFDVAGSAAPEKNLPAFADTTAGLSVDVESSDDTRVGLRIVVVEDLDEDVPGHEDLHFEVSRAGLAHAAYGIAEVAGGVDLADFGAINK